MKIKLVIIIYISKVNSMKMFFETLNKWRQGIPISINVNSTKWPSQGDIPLNK